MIEAVTLDGYCIAQANLPAAAEWDIRMFVMNGRPLTHEGQFAAFRPVNRGGDVRSNMRTGGKSEPADVTPPMLELVELVRPKLSQDGMFLRAVWAVLRPTRGLRRPGDPRAGAQGPDSAVLRTRYLQGTDRHAVSGLLRIGRSLLGRQSARLAIPARVAMMGRYRYRREQRA